MTFVIDSAESMEEFGKRIARYSPAGIRIFLQGELGAGKTTLVRGFLHELGHEGKVKSPTYTLVEPYIISDEIVVYHFDLYRLVDPMELESIGIRDYYSDSAICVIEWPEKAEGFLGSADLSVSFEICSEQRNISVLANSDKGKALLENISS